MSEVRPHLRGNLIYYDGIWRYVDTGLPTTETWKGRACGHCLKPNREDEHDACLGELPGVINACCGHGNVREAYVQFEGGQLLQAEKAQAHFEQHKRTTQNDS